ncbi:Na(+)/H(+) exchange regulatory cofactor NHE-RF2 [Eucyclogobius newberryi]|uniref:Na(+)/H(+) exchange regulatory cofactor NHE-RF2 n=1 Tax=Eucyclogobius newberryi TaxID=166745 RepID=UPI003B5C5084
MGEMSGEMRPRLCVMTKAEDGYGFHLHGEKGKSGQYIRRVEAGSPAEASGLRAGDRLVAVNGANVERETHHQVVQRIKAVENETRLLVVDQETDESLRSLRLTATEEMAIHGAGPQSSSSSSTPAPSPRPSTPSAPSTPTKKRENGSVAKQPVQKPTRRVPSKAAKKEAQAQIEAEAQAQRELSQTPDLSPRLCHMARTEKGYGFNLHSDRSRPGQYIRSLDPGSPADQAGLRPQDRLVEVNGVNIEGMRHADVVAFIKRGGDETWLLVVDLPTDQHFKRRGITPTLSHVKDYDGPPIFTDQLSPQINGGSSTQSIRSTQSDLSSQGNSTQLADDDGSQLLDPFSEIGLRLSATAAEEKMKVHAKEKRKAPQMDWMKKYELFRNF